jgi:hypothetical protein
MTRTPFALTLAAAAALAGCNTSDHTIVSGPPDDPSGDSNAAANDPVTLPPAIVASKVYRCADNKVIYVDYLSDKKSANVRTEQSGPSTPVAAAEAGKPMTAPGGYELSGSAASSTAKIAIPGHASQSCKA